MQYITLILGLVLSCSAAASDLSVWLKDKNLNGYFPADADYHEFRNACNEAKCFHLVAVQYVSLSNKGIRRLAVFSDNGEYLGVYSGFDEMPLRLEGSRLIFLETENGSAINFNGETPPQTVYIDGAHYEFEPRKQ